MTEQEKETLRLIPGMRMEAKIKNNKIMELKKELEKLEAFKSLDADKFEAQLLYIRKSFTSPEDVQVIDNRLMQMLSGTAQKVDAFIRKASMKIQLAYA